MCFIFIYLLYMHIHMLEKTLILGETESRRRRDWQRIRRLDDITDSMEMSLSKLREIVKDREAWSAAVHRVLKESDMTYWLNNNNIYYKINNNYIGLYIVFTYYIIWDVMMIGSVDDVVVDISVLFLTLIEKLLSTYFMKYDKTYYDMIYVFVRCLFPSQRCSSFLLSILR